MSCVGCNNCYFRQKRFVGYRGNLAAPIVFIGEGPGKKELEGGLPMIGPSGKILTNQFPKDWTDENFLITNALRCAPIKIGNTTKDQKHLMNAVTRCRHRLFEELRIAPRKVIVTLGNGALWALTGNESLKITQCRGALIESPLAEIGIIPTVHPAFMMRGGAGYFKKYKMDIAYAITLSQGMPPIKWEYPEYVVARSVDDVKNFEYELAQLAETDPYIASDLETGDLSHIKGEILCTGFSINEKRVLIVPEDLIQYTKSIYEDKRFKFIWHNGKFDIKFLRRMGIDARVDEDTMLQSYCLNENKGLHDLDQVASDVLKAPNHKNMLKKYLPNKQTSYRVIPKPILHEYAAYDISKTKGIHVKLREEIRGDSSNEKLYAEMLIPASKMLANVETNGLAVNHEQVLKNSVNVLAQMERFEGIINKHAQNILGKDINPRSWMQVQELLYKGLKLAPSDTATDEKTLKKLRRHGAVKAILRYRKEAKLYSTYIKPFLNLNTPKHKYIIEYDGKVHPTFKIHGTVTGRLACSEPNLQNIPRAARMRSQFQASGPGRILYARDYDQAELRCLAIYSDDPELCRIYEEGKTSIHKVVACDIYGEDWADRHSDETRRNNPEAYELAALQYIRAKAVNFGIVYGRTAPSLAEEHKVSIREAEGMIDSWKQRFPQAWAFIERCREAPLNNKTLKTRYGRRKRATLVSAENKISLQNEAANFPHQSLANDFTLEAAIIIDPQLIEYDTMLVNLIHDEHLYDVVNTRECILKLAADSKRIMEQVPINKGVTRIPFLTDAKIGFTWGDMQPEEEWLKQND